MRKYEPAVAVGRVGFGCGGLGWGFSFGGQLMVKANVHGESAVVAVLPLVSGNLGCIHLFALVVWGLGWLDCPT